MAEKSRLNIELRVDKAIKDVKRFNRSIKSSGSTAVKTASRIDKLEKEYKQLAAAMKKASSASTRSSSGMRTFAKFGRATEQVVRRLGLAFAFLAAAILGVGIKAAKDFEAEMVKIETLVGIARSQVNAWRKDVLKIAADTGISAVKVAQGLFAITSGGERGAEAVRELRIAAQAAALGLGDLGSVARLGAAFMQVYGASITNANERVDAFRQGMGELVLAVRAGNLEAAELAPTIGRALGPAEALGVSFAELTSFIATFSRTGVPAAEAVTSVNSLFTTMIRNSEQASLSLREYGLRIEDVRDRIRNRGLADTLVFLNRMYGNNISGLQDLISNIRALRGVLGVTGQQWSNYLKIANEAAGANNIVEESFARIQDTAQQAFNELRETALNVLIEIFSSLLPAFRAWADALKSASQSKQFRESLDKISERLDNLVQGIDPQSFIDAVNNIGKAIVFVVENLDDIVTAVTTIAGIGFVAMMVNWGKALGGVAAWLLKTKIGMRAMIPIAGTFSLALGPVVTTIISLGFALNFFNKFLARGHSEMLISIRNFQKYRDGVDDARATLDTLNNALANGEEIKIPGESQLTKFRDLIKRMGEEYAKLADEQKGVTKDIENLSKLGKDLSEVGRGKKFALMERFQQLKGQMDILAASGTELHGILAAIIQLGRDQADVPLEEVPQRSDPVQDVVNERLRLLGIETAHRFDNLGLSESQLRIEKRQNDEVDKANEILVRKRILRKDIGELTVKQIKAIRDVAGESEFALLVTERITQQQKAQIALVSQVTKRYGLAAAAAGEMGDALLEGDEAVRSIKKEILLAQAIQPFSEIIGFNRTEEQVAELTESLRKMIGGFLESQFELEVITTALRDLNSAFEDIAVTVTGGLLEAFDSILRGGDIGREIENIFRDIAGGVGEIFGVIFAEKVGQSIQDIMGPAISRVMSKALTEGKTQEAATQLANSVARQMGQAVATAIASAIANIAITIAIIAIQAFLKSGGPSGFSDIGFDGGRLSTKISSADAEITETLKDAFGTIFDSIDDILDKVGGRLVGIGNKVRIIDNDGKFKVIVDGFVTRFGDDMEAAIGFAIGKILSEADILGISDNIRKVLESAPLDLDALNAEIATALRVEEFVMGEARFAIRTTMLDIRAFIQDATDIGLDIVEVAVAANAAMQNAINEILGIDVGEFGSRLGAAAQANEELARFLSEFSESVSLASEGADESIERLSGRIGGDDSERLRALFEKSNILSVFNDGSLVQGLVSAIDLEDFANQLIQEFSGQGGGIADALADIEASADSLRDAIADLGLESDKTAKLIEAVGAAEQSRVDALGIGTLDGLFAQIRSNEELKVQFAAETLAFERLKLEIERAQLEIQLRTLGIWEAWAAIVTSVFDAASAAIKVTLEQEIVQIQKVEEAIDPLVDLFEQVASAFESFTGFNTVVEDLNKINDLASELLEFLGEIELSMSDLADATAKVVAAQKLQILQLENDTLGALFGYLDSSIGFEQERADLAKSKLDLEFALIEAQLQALGLFKQFTDVFESAYTQALEAIKDGIRLALDPIRDLLAEVEGFGRTASKTLSQALRDFNSLADEIIGGDFTNLDDLAGSGDSFLKAIEDVFGNSAAGRALAADMARTLEDVLAQEQDIVLSENIDPEIRDAVKDVSKHVASLETTTAILLDENTQALLGLTDVVKGISFDIPEISIDISKLLGEDLDDLGFIISTPLHAILDANLDGFISLEEAEGIISKELFGILDRNNDGLIDVEEAILGGFGGVSMFDALDVDRDGYVSIVEAEGRINDSLFKLLDIDGDGFITLAEVFEAVSNAQTEAIGEIVPGFIDGTEGFFTPFFDRMIQGQDGLFGSSNDYFGSEALFNTGMLSAAQSTTDAIIANGRQITDEITLLRDQSSEENEDIRREFSDFKDSLNNLSGEINESNSLSLRGLDVIEEIVR